MADQIHPLYLVVDKSIAPGAVDKRAIDSSDYPILAINEALSGFTKRAADQVMLSNRVKSLLSRPLLPAPGVKVCLIGFSGEAEVEQSLEDVAAIGSGALFRATKTTDSCYGAAFDLLRETITADLGKLVAAAEAEVTPPAVFFLTGSKPADDWAPAYRRLIDSRPQPRIVTFGYGDADAETMRQVGTMDAFVSNGSLSQDEVLQAAVEAMTIMMSDRSPALQLGLLPTRPRIDGFDRFSRSRLLPAPPSTMTSTAPPSGAASANPGGAGEYSRRQQPKVEHVPYPRAPVTTPAFPAPPALGPPPKAAPPVPLLLPDGLSKVPDTVLDGVDHDGLSVRGASLRGADHQASGASRQDAMGIYQLRGGEVEAILGVVADGADAAPLSHLGAAESCRLLADEAQRRLPDLFAAQSVHDLTLVCEDLMAAVADRLVRLAGSLKVDTGALPIALAAAAVETGGHPYERRCFYLRSGDCRVYQMRTRGAGSTEQVRNWGTVGQLELGPGIALLLTTSGLAKLMGDRQVRDGTTAWWREGNVPGLQEFAWQLSFQHAGPDAQADDRTAICFWPR